MRLGDLLGVLRTGQLGRLLLESYLLDPAPRRLELLIGGKPQLVGCAQFGGDRLEAVPRRGQCLLGATARDQLRLQRLLDRRPVDLLALGRQLREQRLLRNLCGDRLAPPGELGDALAARALGESSFLRRTLCHPRALAPSSQRDFRFVARMPCALALGRLRAEPRALCGDLGIDRHHRIVLGAFLDGERGELVRDLRPPALGRVRHLLQLQ